MRGLLILEMLVFMLMLVVGFIYVWQRGALEWD
ncbi:MAG: NADH-quinone oxidoreductase subunit A [Gemmatimonadales bacterium]